MKTQKTAWLLLSAVLLVSGCELLGGSDGPSIEFQTEAQSYALNSEVVAHLTNLSAQTLESSFCASLAMRTENGWEPVEKEKVCPIPLIRLKSGQTKEIRTWLGRDLPMDQYRIQTYVDYKGETVPVATNSFAATE